LKAREAKREKRLRGQATGVKYGLAVVHLFDTLGLADASREASSYLRRSHDLDRGQSQRIRLTECGRVLPLYSDSASRRSRLEADIEWIQERVRNVKPCSIRMPRVEKEVSRLGHDGA
jgi:hypothetical protein